jgi:hypothetical protein
MAADDVLPILLKMGVWHKLPINMSKWEELCKRPDEQGKFITIYSSTPQQAQEIAEQLFQSAWVQGCKESADGKYDRIKLGTIPGDVLVLGTENLYCRYGSFGGKHIPGPEIGTAVQDNRNVGWPPWLMGYGEMLKNGITQYPSVGNKELTWNEALDIARKNNQVIISQAIGVMGGYNRRPNVQNRCK